MSFMQYIYLFYFSQFWTGGWLRTVQWLIMCSLQCTGSQLVGKCWQWTWWTVSSHCCWLLRSMSDSSSNVWTCWWFSVCRLRCTADLPCSDICWCSLPSWLQSKVFETSRCYCVTEFSQFWSFSSLLFHHRYFFNGWCLGFQCVWLTL